MTDTVVLTTPIEGSSPARWTAIAALVALTGTPLLGCLLSAPSRASADEAPVGPRTAAAYSVLGGQTVTNTGPSTVNGSGRYRLAAGPAAGLGAVLVLLGGALLAVLRSRSH